MTVILTLGGIIFQDFEVPDSIRIGGDQMLVVHKLPGGARTIDAMGADDADIPWSGRFRGAQAEARARILEGYRTSGQPFLLKWSTYRYQVIVQSFKAEYQQPFEIPYTINCTVVSDESAPILTGIPGIDELIGSDLGRALGLSDSLGIAAIGTALTTAQQAINVAGTLRNAPSDTITQIVGTLSATQQAVGASVTAANAIVASSTPVTAGGDPASMAFSLSNQSSAFGQLNQLYQLGSTVTRMSKNLQA
ncbi:hypothetical protein [Limnoglobus roseus]|uniref:Phage tail protein n=1 Tax=Limnoglobus roseus TaxID=2598579 RepID=A0A5C1A6I8_9BACT|nr:hypothetical protein [Limnoglobus roseus]QEL14791.1 hypothetical protein PX52LOC_01685 [Limnoglobus roseus]